MKKRKIIKQNSILIFVFVVIIAFGFRVVSAQFPIKIPKLPKVEKPKQEPPKTDDNGKNQPDTIAPSQPSKLNSENIYKNQLPTNVPVCMKNSIYVQARTHSE